MVRKRNKRHVLNAWSYNTCHKIHGMFVADHTNLVYCLFCPILPTYSSHHWKERNTTIPLVREILQCLELQISQPRLIILIIFCFFLHTETKISYIGKNITIVGLSSLFLMWCTLCTKWFKVLVAKMSISFRFYHLIYIYKSLLGYHTFPPFLSGKRRIRCGNHTFFWNKK